MANSRKNSADAILSPDDPDIIVKRVKMNEDQWNVYRRPISFILHSVLIVLALTMFIVLLWHRFTWGFEEWIHEVTFYNFWNGTYIVVSGAVLLFDSSALGIWAVRRRSICGLLLSCVMHGATILLLLVGSIAMMSDAFATREVWLARMIIDMIDPVNYNNNALKDMFLGNLYRIVECCGADGYQDYTDRFEISPHQECVDRRHAGGIYFEEGCAHKFSVWLKAWAGCTTFVCLVVVGIEILLMFWMKQQLRIIKRKQRQSRESAAKDVKRKEEKEKLMNHGIDPGGPGGVSGESSVQFGRIQHAKSVDNLDAPPAPFVRSSSKTRSNHYAKHAGEGMPMDSNNPMVQLSASMGQINGNPVLLAAMPMPVMPMMSMTPQQQFVPAGMNMVPQSQSVQQIAQQQQQLNQIPISQSAQQFAHQTQQQQMMTTQHGTQTYSYGGKQNGSHISDQTSRTTVKMDSVSSGSRDRKQPDHQQDVKYQRKPEPLDLGPGRGTEDPPPVPRHRYHHYEAIDAPPTKSILKSPSSESQTSSSHKGSTFNSHDGRAFARELEKEGAAEIVEFYREVRPGKMPERTGTMTSEDGSASTKSFGRFIKDHAVKSRNQSPNQSGRFERNSNQSSIASGKRKQQSPSPSLGRAAGKPVVPQPGTLPTTTTVNNQIQQQGNPRGYQRSPSISSSSSEASHHGSGPSARQNSLPPTGASRKSSTGSQQSQNQKRQQPQPNPGGLRSNWQNGGQPHTNVKNSSSSSSSSSSPAQVHRPPGGKTIVHSETKTVQSSSRIVTTNNKQSGSGSGHSDSSKNSAIVRNSGYVNLENPFRPGPSKVPVQATKARTSSSSSSDEGTDTSSARSATFNSSMNVTVIERPLQGQGQGQQGQPPPKLAKKPQIQESKGEPNIFYGYENVLPVSQRFKYDPYGMLSSATDTETATSMTCTSDDETDSDYPSRYQMQLEKKKLFQQHLARMKQVERIEEEQDSRNSSINHGHHHHQGGQMRKRLAPSETSL